jgi:hypothetical protein
MKYIDVYTTYISKKMCCVLTLIAYILLLTGCDLIGAPHKSEIYKHLIWDHAEHNAFTDLVHYKGILFCAFREGPKHGASHQENIRII